MNKFIITGRLTSDPELTETSAGVSLCHFSLGVQRDYKTDGEYKTDFFDVTAWRELAKTVARYSKKGDKVLVEGSVQPRQYEDNNGVKHKTFDIMAQKVEFLTPKARNVDDEAKHSEEGERSTRPAHQLQAFDDDGDIPF